RPGYYSPISCSNMAMLWLIYEGILQYFASKIKECQCIIKITEPNLIIKCLAPTGFIKENHKIEFLKD
ncbi:hypothetical protein, partial [Shewanella xiamenensis]|uniref:hypothetical protein n=1 Tax=Shewanella xiamenensis TaxID=332186 RepID=UPI0021BE1CB4